MMEMNRKISISVISHGQGKLIKNLLSDLDRLGIANYIEEVILTCNIEEHNDFKLDNLTLRVINNVTPKGFGANHNAAYRLSKGDFFCVVNPDIRLPSLPFQAMVESFQKYDAGIVVPFVFSTSQQLENSLRRFPTIRNVIAKLLGMKSYLYLNGEAKKSDFTVEWGGGMFMLFSRDSFQQVNGFDEGFFLYYEDVDICTRMWKQGKPVVVSNNTVVIHDAQRSSHKKLRYFIWHVSSMFRYFFKHWLRLPKTLKVHEVE